jgi:hypothetical protein
MLEKCDRKKKKIGRGKRLRPLNKDRLRRLKPKLMLRFKPLSMPKI